MNYTRNKKFFKPNVKIVAWIAVFIAGFVAGFIIAGSAIVGLALGAIIVGVGIALTRRPSFEDILKECEEEAKKAKQEGLSRLGLDESEVNLIDPIVIQGFCYDYSFSDKDLDKSSWIEVSYKSGKQIWATPVYVVNVMYFSDHVVNLYTRKFSLVSTSDSKNTDEYFYKDIVSVSTTTENGKRTLKNNKEVAYTYDSMQLRNSGGGTVNCSVKDSSEIQTQLNGFRALLKQKKVEK